MPVVEPQQVKFTISSTCTKHEENRFHWYFWVAVDPAVEHVVDRIVRSTTCYGHRSKIELERSESNPCHFQSPWQRSWESHVLRVRIYMKDQCKDVLQKDTEVKYARSAPKLKFDHELNLRVGETHTTHHTAALKVPERIPANEPSSEQEEPESTCVPPPMWCISYQQLMDVEQKARKKCGPEEYSKMTMRDICEKIIQPRCAKKGTSYALSLNPQGLPVDTFVSHSWDGHFAAFVQSIRNIYQTNVVKPNFWICAFALVQGQNEALISQQVGSGEDPLDKSPFVVALQQAANYCVIRNSQMDVFSRIWCVCELMYARQSKLFPTRTSVTGPDAFASMKTSVLDAQASVLKDRDRILRVLLTQFDREEVDDIVQLLRNQSTPEYYFDQTPLSTSTIPPPTQLQEASVQPDISKYGSKVARKSPHEGEFKKIPNDAHRGNMDAHVETCDHSECKEGRRLIELIGWNYKDPRS